MDQNYENFYGENYLYFATLKNNLEMIKILVENGSDYNKLSKK